MPIILPPSEEELEEQAQRQDQLAPHAMRLGHLCMLWATLDGIIDDLFEPLLSCSASQVASIVTNVENTSSRCEMLKRLLVNEAPSPAFRDWLIALLDRVSKELAPLRNRYVHDRWSVTAESIVRTDKKAKILKSQSRQPLRLEFDIRHVTNPNDVNKLNLRITLLIACLSFAVHDLRVWRKTGRPLQPHPEYMEATKANARWRGAAEQLEALGNGPLQSQFVFD